MAVEMDKEVLEPIDLCKVCRMSYTPLDLSWNELHNIISNNEARAVVAQGVLRCITVSKCRLGPARSARKRMRGGPKAQRRAAGHGCRHSDIVMTVLCPHPGEFENQAIKKGAKDAPTNEVRSQIRGVES